MLKAAWPRREVLQDMIGPNAGLAESRSVKCVLCAPVPCLPWPFDYRGDGEHSPPLDTLPHQTGTNEMVLPLQSEPTICQSTMQLRADATLLPFLLHPLSIFPLSLVFFCECLKQRVYVVHSGDMNLNLDEGAITVGIVGPLK